MRENMPPKSSVQRGFSLIELMIVVAIIGIVAAIAIPNFLSSRRSANEASAISAIRTLSTAEETYRATFGGGVSFGTLSDLSAQRVIDSKLATSTSVTNAKNGFIFNIVLTGSGSFYCAGAAPASVHTGSRNFSSDTPGVVFVHALSVAVPPTSTAGGVALQFGN